MFDKVIMYMKKLNDLQKISSENNIIIDILDYDELFNEKTSTIFYKDFATIKENNIVYIHNLFISGMITNQESYLFNITDSNYSRFENVVKSNLNVYSGFIDEYNESFERYKKYLQNNKTNIIIDFIEHFYFTLEQIIKQKNQNYYNTIQEIYSKIKEIEYETIYNKFYNSRKLYLPILFYINNNEELESKIVDTYLTFKIQLNIDLKQKMVIKLNDRLSVTDKQKFEKLLNILLSKQVINKSVKDYLMDRIDKFPLFNDFTVKDNIVKVRLFDYIDVRILPYLFILNALYCKKIYT